MCEIVGPTHLHSEKMCVY